ncbi:MAG: tetratricopeptide repeat protein [Anaerolineae bacterium]
MNQHTLPEIQKDVGDGFKYVREGRILELSALPLAQTRLVTDCLLTGHPITPDIRGRTFRSVLRWATDRLKPGGEHNWYANEWRNFNTLNFFYLEGLKVAELSEKMGIADQTLYLVRSEAIAAVTQVLLEEIKSPVDGKRRKNYSLEDQYKLQTNYSRKILRLLAAFGQSMPYRLISSVLQVNDNSDLIQSLSELVNSGLIISDPTFSTVLVHPETIDFLALQLSSNEIEEWHELMADYFLEQENFIEAATHYKKANQPQKCASILLNNHEAIINDMQIEDLQQLLRSLKRTELNDDTWIQIQLLEGDNLKLMGNLEGAIDAYQKALSAESIALKAQAYYQRAMALFLINLDEALAHYNYCIQLLSTEKVNTDLLTQAFIGQANVYLHENQLDIAENSLQEATQIIDESNREIFSYLQSAWTRLSTKKNDLKKAASHGQQAWLAASEIGDSVRMAEMSYNLGVIYAQLGDFGKSSDYLEKSSVIAKEIGNLEVLAVNRKTLGGLYFIQKDYENAIKEYEAAWEMLTNMGNLNWQTHTAYDLAEVYGEVNDVAKFWDFYKKGVALAQEFGNSSLAEEFFKLKEKFGFQDNLENLNDRQMAAIHHMRQYGKITNREFQSITQLSPRQALRELQDLVEKSIIEKAGKGRSVHYRLL